MGYTLNNSLFHMSEKRLGTSSNPGWHEYDLLAAEGKRLAKEARERKKREAAQSRLEAAALKKKQIDQREIEAADEAIMDHDQLLGEGYDDTHPTKLGHRKALLLKDEQIRSSTIGREKIKLVDRRYRDKEQAQSLTKKTTGSSTRRRSGSFTESGEYRQKEAPKNARRGRSIRELDEIPPKDRSARFTTALAEIQEEQERETREAALRKQIDALKAEGHDLYPDVQGLTENTPMNPEQAMEMALVMHKGRQGQPEREALEAERAAHKARRDYKKGLRKPSPEARVDEEQALEAELAELETLGEGSERKTPWNRLRDGLSALFS
jgi:hypothetical protein